MIYIYIGYNVEIFGGFHSYDSSYKWLNYGFSDKYHYCAHGAVKDSKPNYIWGTHPVVMASWGYPKLAGWFRRENP